MPHYHTCPLNHSEQGSASVEQDAKYLLKSGQSDHDPISATFDFKSSLPPGDRPILPEVLHRSTYKYFLENLAQEERSSHSEFQSEFGELQCCRSLMEAASQLTRDYMQGYNGDTLSIKF